MERERTGERKEGRERNSMVTMTAAYMHLTDIFPGLSPSFPPELSLAMSLAAKCTYGNAAVEPS